MRLLRLLPVFSALLLVITACGSPATAATEVKPTLALPTRISIVPTAGPKGSGQATPIANQPIAEVPTVAPAIVAVKATSAPTLIPTKGPPTTTPNVPSATPLPNPAVARGETLFAKGIGKEAVPTCASCHYVDKDEPFTGPSQVGIGRRAATRVKGQDAATYIRTSIINPNAFLVPNQKGPDGADHIYAAGGASLMYQNYAKELTADQIGDLTAYLLTLK